jgi:uncharacterized protein
MKLHPRVARLAVITVLAGTTLLAGVQAAAQGTTSSPAKKELVQRALQLQQPGIEAVGAALANQTASQVMQMAGQALTRVPEDKRRTVGAELEAEVRKFQSDVTPLLRASAVKWAPSTLGVSLDEKFSEEELKSLIAWLESPVSRKYQQLSNESLPALSQKMIAETRPQVEPKLKALEQSMAAKLNAAMATPPASAPRNSGTPPAPNKK